MWLGGVTAAGGKALPLGAANMGTSASDDGSDAADEPHAAHRLQVAPNFDESASGRASSAACE